ncbi:MAG: TonB-dependent receptor plug domain-containing protein [Telmatospirillum sp.]|nr:TonB-dependent receptor plug domain-containing protein [Telmatospirillum sp.]
MRAVRHGAGLAFFFLSAAMAAAQDFDYGRYEALFGEPVTVSATGKPERVSDTQVLMDVITAEDIRRSGARDIPALVRRLAGVDSTHSSSGEVGIGLGGYNQPSSGRVLVLINGREVSLEGVGDVLWSTLPVELEEIRQIEVLHGPQSALYGFNAVDGVINIITFDPVDDAINTAKVRAGTQDRRGVSAITTLPLSDSAGVRLAAAGDHVEDGGRTPFTPGRTSVSKDPNRRAFSFDFGARIADVGRVSLEASHTDVSQRLFYTNRSYDTRVTTDSAKGGWSADTPVGLVTATMSYSDVTMPWVSNPRSGTFHVDERIAQVGLSDLFKLGADDSFRVGFDGRRDRLDAPGLISGVLTGDLLAGSAMWEHQFTNSLSAVNAVRYDYYKLDRQGGGDPMDIYRNADFDRSDQGVSVNSALVAKVTEDDKIRLSVSRGLKLPSLTDFAQVGRVRPLAMAAAPIYGNPMLRASGVYGYRAGWDHQFRDLGITSRVAFFHDMTLSHVDSFSRRSHGGVIDVTGMGAGSVSNGLEVGFDRKAKEGWVWGGNVTYQRLHEHRDWGLRNAAPISKANAHLGYSWGDWEADLYGAYTSRTKGIGVTGMRPYRRQIVPIKEYVTLSPRLAWHPGDMLTVELTADNLWPYQDSLYYRMETSYGLTLRLRY